MQKTWLIAGGSDPMTTCAELQDCLLAQRGVKSGQALSFLQPKYERDVHDPFALYGMDKAVAAIDLALSTKKRIIVYGDYDVDGISGAALLTTTLQFLGGNVTPFLPDRFSEGYGLHQRVLESLAPGCDLLITVDCGVSNYYEIQWLLARGIPTVVVDHHELPPGDLPPAVAVLHPRHPKGSYPFAWLSGAGMAWKLCAALLRKKGTEGQKFLDSLLDLVVLGTIADMVPLQGENRVIARYGLGALQATTRLGLQRLFAKLRLESTTLTSEQLSWRVLPRLNAAGKMDHAYPALELLLTHDVVRANELAAQIDGYNQERQSHTAKVLRAVESQLSDTSPVCAAFDRWWPAGVVGLVASRLVHAYHRPAVVIGGNGQHAVGSARAPEGVNILELLRAGEKHALKLGGHARAAGFSVEFDRVKEFLSAVQDAGQHMRAAPVPQMRADAAVGTSLLSWDTLQLLEQFAPFGEGNRPPVLVAKGIKLAATRAVGKDGSHAKCLFVADGRPLEGIAFGMAAAMPKAGGLVDIVFELSRNVYKGRHSLQAQVHDIAPAGQVLIDYVEIATDI